MVWSKTIFFMWILVGVLMVFFSDAGATRQAPEGKKVPAGESKKEVTESIARDPYIGAIVIDARDGRELFSNNADATGYPASVVKLMNLLLLQERIAQGSLRLDEQVTITAEAARIGGTQVYLKEGEVFPVEELTYAMMVESANDAATALAVHVAGSRQGFVELMNNKARELGMKSTVFASVHGLPPSKGQAHDRTTPRDLAILSRALLQYPDILNYTSTRERPFREGSFTLRSHNHLLGSFPGADGLKTGFIRAGGYTIAVTAQKNGARVIAVIMGSANRKERDRQAADLLAKGLLKIAPTQPAAPSAAKAAVQEKQAPPAEPVASTTPAATVPRPQGEPVRTPPAGSTRQETLNWNTILLAGGGVLVGILIGVFFAMGRGRRRRF